MRRKYKRKKKRQQEREMKDNRNVRLHQISDENVSDLAYRFGRM